MKIFGTIRYFLHFILPLKKYLDVSKFFFQISSFELRNLQIFNVDKKQINYFQLKFET